MKNDLLDVCRMWIMPDDSKWVLEMLQEAVDTLGAGENMEVIIYCFRFGEKMTGGLGLEDFDRESVRRVTVHAAVDISSEGVDVLWSMYGLQAIVGNRGVLSSCLSLSDSGNFQSNLDGRLIDISPCVRSLCNCRPDKVRFVQFYADVPHRKPKARFHPVSGCVGVRHVCLQSKFVSMLPRC